MNVVYKFNRWTLSAFFLAIFALNAAALPNLTPYQQTGWSDKLVIAKTSGATNDSTNFTTSDTIYASWSVINNGTTSTGGSFFVYLYVDGVQKASWNIGTTPANNYTYVIGQTLGSLLGGTHTIQITADATGVISESDETDNSYSRTITVTGANLPNLAPYQPPGWSDKIVVARSTGTTTDSTGLTTSDTLYVNWAVINKGNVATSNSFLVNLVVDGVTKNTWNDSSPMAPNSYTFINNFSIGSLSQGTHNIQISADIAGTVTESDETDNSYTKVITVGNPNQPNLAPYQPAGWSDKVVIARTTNTVTDSTGLTTADTLYADWAVINNGLQPTASSFSTYLYVDGVLQTNVTTASPFNTNVFTTVTNFFIGNLSPTNHIIEVYADATGTISEVSETDNIYMKNITVSPALLPGVTLNSPVNGSVTQPTTPTFSWTPSAGATSYRIIVATSASDLPSDPTATNGGASVVINATTAGTNYTPGSALTAGTTYYWEVHGLSPLHYGTWSATSSFTTAPLLNGLSIIPTFDSSITSDPQAATIEATILSAITLYSNSFANPVTVNITYKKMTNGLGQSEWTYQTISYSNYRAALMSSATTADDATALAHLPVGTGNPVNGSTNVIMKPPLGRALGFNINPSGGEPDGTISLNIGSMNLSAAQTNASKYSLFSTVCHEMDEVLGLGSSLDFVKDGELTLTGAISPEDLFRYDGAGARNYATNQNATSYFSLDGVTDLAQFNQQESGDYGDWYSFFGGVTPQVQDAFLPPGVSPVPGVELRALDAIGYNLAAAATQTPPSFTSITRTGNALTLTWSAVSGQSYQVQNKTNLLQASWNNSGGVVTATNSTASLNDTLGPDQKRFYHVALLSTPAPHFAKSKVQVVFGPGGRGTNHFNPLHP